MSRRSFLQHNPNQNYGARYQVRWEARGQDVCPGRRSPPLPPCFAIHAFPMHLRACMQVFDLTSQGPAPFVALSSFYPHVSRLVPSCHSFGRCLLWCRPVDGCGDRRSAVDFLPCRCRAT